MCECLMYADGSQYTCEACVPLNEYAHERVKELEAALRPFCDPESYTTAEEECRRNPAMDWCAIHSFRWPCPVEAARRALAGGGK